MSKKALVLSSGGVDSTTCVSVAVHELAGKTLLLFPSFMGRNIARNLTQSQESG